MRWKITDPNPDTDPIWEGEADDLEGVLKVFANWKPDDQIVENEDGTVSAQWWTNDGVTQIAYEGHTYTVEIA